MRVIFAALLMVSVWSATAQAGGITKCTVDGKVVYSDRDCAAGGQAILMPEPTKFVETKITVTPELAKKCFDAYRIHSLDPTEAKMLGYFARTVEAGFAVLSVDAVFRNKVGGPDRTMLWCPLTKSLDLDEKKIDAHILDDYRKRH